MVSNRYPRMSGFHSKQTIVKMLDSDDEEDQKEIEKNRKAIASKKPGQCNNPKLKKRLKTLEWVFGPENSISPKKSESSKNPTKKRNGKSYTNRRVHNHLYMKGRPIEAMMTTAET